MDNRKRQRLEVTPSASATATLTTNALPTAIALPTTTIGAQSFFLSSSGTNHDNVLLTICDEQSDESEEYLTLDDDALTAATTHIKREQLANVLPLQYRIVNTLRNAGIDASSNCCSNNNNNASSVNTTTNTLPTSVQLPSGCDIYLVKEYMESTPTNTVKLEANEESNVILQHNLSTQCLRPKPVASTTTLTTATAGTVGGDSQAASKRSFILETYKKRDDRRRATHNEVERRRRDKINSWIFKLKEMLPEMQQTSGGNSSSAGNNNNNGNSNNSSAFNNSNTNNSHINNNCNNNQNTTASCSTSNNSSSCRATSGDSKSQILIKACEYIKTMQAELQSLRECLTENENLRLSNQRLQNELDQLRNEPSNISNNSNNNHNNNSSSGSVSSSSSTIICNNQLVSNKNHSYNLTLNSLNSNGSIFSTSSPAANAAAAAAAALTTYTKRELIIRDYVD